MPSPGASSPTLKTMLHLCATKFLAPWLLAWSFSGHPDALALKASADSFGVPTDLIYAVAFVETRHSTRNTEVSSAGALGRLQIMPGIWHRTCGSVWGRRRYAANVHCGALILALYFRNTGNWLDAATRYCGTGPDALAYRRQIELALGRYWWQRTVFGALLSPL